MDFPNQKLPQKMKELISLLGEALVEFEVLGEINSVSHYPKFSIVNIVGYDDLQNRTKDKYRRVRRLVESVYPAIYSRIVI